MTLLAGSTLAHYRIEAPLGAGSMGEVYRARDTRLDREVAIKVLPTAFATDGERRKRLEREAKALASLNHPSVAQIHGFDQIDDTYFLVLELVPGESLEERLRRGPLRVDESIEVCRQIAEGVDAAHEAGVIHRDIKPANVLLTPRGDVKVLDFGLAKPSIAVDAAGSTQDSVLSTGEGALIGTPTYMAPEQVRGRAIDRRVDIWAIGCLLYECLTGKRAYGGETLSDVIASVLDGEPDWSALGASVTPRLRELIASCLTKDPRQRLRDAGDLRLELQRIARGDRGHVAIAGAGARRLWVAFAAGAVLAVLVTWGLWPNAESERAAVRRFTMSCEGTLRSGFQALAISPNGSRIVYRGTRHDGASVLFMRPLDDLVPRELPGSEECWLPFFSPDGRQIGFATTEGIGVLRVLNLETGIVRDIASLDVGFAGAAWLDDDTIVVTSTVRNAIGEVQASGGKVEYWPLPGTEPSDFLVSPSALPGHRAVLCGVNRHNRFRIAAVDLVERSMTPMNDDEGFTPTYARTGHVVYQRGQNGPLMALPFDIDELTATGPAFPTLTDLDVRGSMQARLFALADDGTLVYVPSTGEGSGSELLWLDRQGQTTAIAEIDKLAAEPRISGDGRWIVFRASAPQCELWVHDLHRGITSAVTLAGDNHGVAWDRDDRHVAFARSTADLYEPKGSWCVFRTAVDGSSEVSQISTTRIMSAFVSSFSSDGKHVLLRSTSPTTGLDIDLVAAADGDVQPLLRTPAAEGGGVFSPDGRFVAYTSDVEGVDEVYVQPFPAFDERVKISIDGGSDPVWSRAGDELFFRKGRKMMVAAVTLEPGFSAGRPQFLFESDLILGRTKGIAGYDVRSDGQAFVIANVRSSGSSGELHVVLGWLEVVRSSAPRAAGGQPR